MLETLSEQGNEWLRGPDSGALRRPWDPSSTPRFSSLVAWQAEAGAGGGAGAGAAGKVLRLYLARAVFVLGTWNSGGGPAYHPP